MTDVNSHYHNGAYPSPANAGIVEGGAYMIGTPKGCSLPAYDPLAVESVAVNWIKAGHKALIAVSLYYYCDPNINDWEILLKDMSYYIQESVSASAFTRYWGGFILDEEKDYWTTNRTTGYNASTTLNNYVYGLGVSQGDYDVIWAPYIEIGNDLGWWSQSQYNNLAVVSGFTAAPQIVTSFMKGMQNTLVADYGEWTLVTCEPEYPGLQPPYNQCSTAIQQINGAPFQNAEWGSGNWYNEFLPA
jgi:hypothetical protein